MKAFEDKVVIVVGAGRGIGRATALALAAHGARLVVQDNGVSLDGTGEDESVVAGLVDDLKALGADAIGLATDASAAGAARATVDAALTAFGRVDAGFYAAGLLREKPLLRVSDDDLDRLLDVQARGAFRFAREMAKSFVELKVRGSLLLCSSPAGFAGTPGQAGLAAAALAVVGFARTAATELRRQGVRINVLVPTARTRMTEDLPLFRSIRPDSLSAEHAAQVACHLLSAAADEVSGEVIGVAGGRSYAFRSQESPGVFLEGPPAALEVLAARFREVLGQ